MAGEDGESPSSLYIFYWPRYWIDWWIDLRERALEIGCKPIESMFRLGEGRVGEMKVRDTSIGLEPLHPGCRDGVHPIYC